MLGKKIFFLYPSVLVQNEVIPELIEFEYEVYISTDEKKLKTALQKYPGSIVFVNIDDGLSQEEWDIWIQSVMKADGWYTAVGILAAGSDEKTQKKYINLLKVQAGFIPVKSDIKKILQQITDILHMLGAKGLRKYIRVTTTHDPMVTVNIPYDDHFITGPIKDISVVGLACVFAENPDLKKGTQIKDIQIKLQGVLLKTDGVVFGSCEEEKGKEYVILFTARIDPDVKTKIRKYMQTILQVKMKEELNW